MTALFMILMLIGSGLLTLAVLFMYLPALAEFVGYSMYCTIAGCILTLIGCFRLIGPKTTFKYIGGLILLIAVVVSAITSLALLGII